MINEFGLNNLNLSNVIGALSFALDLTEGQLRGHSYRTAYIALKIGKIIGLNENQIRDLYFASLLKDAGCSSNAFRVYKIFNSNDLVTKYNVKMSDWSNKIESIKFAIKNVKKNNIIEKLFHLYKETGLSPSIMDDLTLARCTRGAEIAKYIGFSEEVSKAIEHLDEHWDGNGSPYKLKGQKIPLFSRIICLSQTMDVFISSVNLEEAYNIIQKRKGKWFDPELVKAAISFKNEIDFWKNYYQIIENPNPQNLLETQEELTIENFDKICEGFSLIVDAKSPYTYQHSTRVAQYSQLIAKEIGYTNLQFIKIAGLLHDIGKLGIPSTILEKPGKLTQEEFETIKLHTKYTYEILKFIDPNLAHIASAHHEKLNGKGYHRNLKNEQITLEMRILCISDIFDALHSERPYRQAIPLEKVFQIMDQEVNNFSIDKELTNILKKIILKKAIL